MKKKSKKEKKKAEPYLIQCNCLTCGCKWRQKSNEKRVCKICGNTRIGYRKYDKDPSKENEH